MSILAEEQTNNKFISILKNDHKDTFKNTKISNFKTSYKNSDRIVEIHNNNLTNKTNDLNNRNNYYKKTSLKNDNIKRKSLLTPKNATKVPKLSKQFNFEKLEKKTEYKKKFIGSDRNKDIEKLKETDKFKLKKRDTSLNNSSTNKNLSKSTNRNDNNQESQNLNNKKKDVFL